MEKEKNIEVKAESQIREASSLPFNRSGNWEHTKRSNFNNNLTGNWPVMCGDFNIFLIQNKGKGPPGKARSPGSPMEFIPDRNDTEPFIVLHGHPLKTKHIFRHRSLSLSKGNTEYNFLQSINSNFLQTLNFKIMKKQILILAMITLAFIFAGTKSYGQDLNYIPAAACAPITPIPCAVADALHPIPGTTYTYTVTVAPGVTTGYIQWFAYNATTTGTVISGGSMAAAIAAAEANGGASQYLLAADALKYNLTTSTSNSITASWQSFDGAAKQILLVAYVKGEGGCSDNIEVFRIQPTFSFTLDIAGLMPTGALPVSGNAVECVTPVQSAVYNGTNLTMNYGDNYVFFTVSAANFVHSWQPTFTIPTNTTQTPVAVTDITWAYPTEAVKTGPIGTWNAATAPILAVAGSGAVGAAGECIVVRVHLVHGNHQNAAAGAITIGVDGVMYNVPTTNYSNLALKDLDPGAAPGPCTNTVTDVATYDLTPRPAITTTAPLVFEPKN